jgi:hypothetical protein
MEDAQGYFTHEEEVRGLMSAWEMQRLSPMGIEVEWGQ